jgi:putative phosphoesterase
MRLLILSDTHSNLTKIKHILEFAERIKVSAFIHCGDWDSANAVYLFKQAKAPVYAVLGNADEAHQQEIEEALKDSNINYEVDTKEVLLDGKRILVAHQPGKIQENIESGLYQIVFHGHTHQRKDKLVGKTRVINPGAVSNTSWPSFAIYDTQSDKVEFIDIVI